MFWSTIIWCITIFRTSFRAAVVGVFVPTWAIVLLASAEAIRLKQAFYHFVEITVEESGSVSGLVYRACEGINPDVNYGFGTKFKSLEREHNPSAD